MSSDFLPFNFSKCGHQSDRPSSHSHRPIRLKEKYVSTEDLMYDHQGTLYNGTRGILILIFFRNPCFAYSQLGLKQGYVKKVVTGKRRAMII